MNINEIILSQFKLPIEYINNSTLESFILSDLELTGEKNIYKHIFKDNNIYSHLLVNKWSSFFTTNTDYLTDFQKLIKYHKTESIVNYKFYNMWVEFKQQTAFKEKYDFIEWNHLDFCNRSPQFMQCISIYNLASPVFNLSIPILFMIFPFIILKFIHKIPITLSSYTNILLKQFKNHAFGKLITEFTSGGNWDKKIYSLLAVAFYIFTIYQNILSCIKFHKNIHRIKKFLYQLKHHCAVCINTIDNSIYTIKKLSSFSEFYDTLKERKQKLQHLMNEFDYIKTADFSFYKIGNVGKLMAHLYSLFYDEDINETICYSFGVLGFIDNINSIKENVVNKKINKCYFRKKIN